MSSPTVVDLFGAPGGMSEGFKQAGFKIIASIDSFGWGCETMKYNHPDTTVFNEDITRMDIPALKNRINGTGIDVLTGGPPCQGFSLVGRPKIASLNGANSGKFIDTRNELYKIYFRIVNKLRPKFFVMENVQGILSYSDGKIKRNILRYSRRVGYDIDYRVLLAADYGVPQRRKRVFFIGNRLEIEDDLFPEPTHQDNSISNHNGNLKPYITLQEALSDLPTLKSGRGKEIVEYNKHPKNSYQKKLRTGSKKVYNHVARFHNERDLKIFKKIRSGVKYTELPENLKPYRDDIFKDKYMVLDPNKPARTIVAHLKRDGLGFIHPHQNRSITVRESARLQSFPDKYRFMGPRSPQFTQVGNAVPPLLAKSIGRHIKKYL